MTNPPLISIIIALPEATALLTNSLESLLPQTHNALELVIATSADIAATLQPTLAEARFCKRFGNHIKLISHNSRSKALLLEQAVQSSTGDYISFLEAGDVYDMDRITTLLESMRENDATVAFGLLDLRGPSNYSYYRYIWELEQFQKQLNFYPYKGLACLNGNHLMMIGNLLVRKSSLLAYGGIGKEDIFYQQDILLRSLFYTEPYVAASVLDWRHVGEAEDDNRLRQDQMHRMQKLYEDFMFRVSTQIPVNPKCISPSHWQSFFNDYVECMNLQEAYNNGLCTALSYRYNQSKT